jgi:chorismate mutase/prephenate dehydratase
MLSNIIFNGLNMLKIESRPIPEKPFTYRFFIDFEGNLNDPSVRNALRGIEAEAGEFRLLGNY